MKAEEVAAIVTRFENILRTELMATRAQLAALQGQVTSMQGKLDTMVAALAEEEEPAVPVDGLDDVGETVGKDKASSLEL